MYTKNIEEHGFEGDLRCVECNREFIKEIENEH